MYKRYLLKCEVEYDSWLGDYTDMKFYFDTKEEMIDFIKNGTEGINPKDIRIECAFELNKIDMEFLNKKETENIMKEHISFLRLPMHITNALIRSKIDTVEKLCNKTYWELHRTRRIGTGSLEKIIDVLSVYDLHLVEDKYERKIN